MCTAVFEKYSANDRLLHFVQPRVIRLLEIFRNFKPEPNSDENQK